MLQQGRGGGGFGFLFRRALGFGVAAAAHETGRDPAMLIAVRTGACVGMATIGFGLLGAGAVVLLSVAVGLLAWQRWRRPWARRPWRR